ncbi:MAG: 50S ribosomal protein L4 [ANME-2 cluster archaeon]|nr:50S ribosomal protein L4 [ANME-2 cluster archaeon]MBC2700037.1 50S ribosomal protein L4 [ANME-2 cluster archaeon]MBC2707446.1 50S ribosomal protein L4 [ANME-2 cluster archaeon]MBC2746333.1 50S ribosomal protein L4 [ANME-2 cluster archaeon]MBC2763651.1 50S ribosomal protein L4 [ANME-2 cluster archaeon]
MSKAKIMDITGASKGDIELPAVFDEMYRPDLIKKAVLAAQANRLQVYGPTPYAGMQTSAANWGPGRGVARVPRIKTGNRVARISQARGGRKAHPPKVEKDYSEKINKKERYKAINSAIAATANPELVRNRGHRFDAELPIVADDEFQDIKTIKGVIGFMEAINVYDDVIRAKNGKHIRAGGGKRRGRKYKKPKSLLIVIGEDNGIVRAARNLSGVDVINVNRLNAELLAPGTHAGRLAIWTESAIKVLGEE